MPLDVLIVQHADKIRLPGDHGLTELGRRQARARGLSLRAEGPFGEMWCSNLHRSRETAELIADALGCDPGAIQADARLTERMNWWDPDGQSLDAFGQEWAHTTVDRDYEPRHGDSSRAAGDRFASFLTELHFRIPDGRVLVVSHGGVTVDLVRTWFGDELVRELAPDAIEHGIPACAITHIHLDGQRRTLHRLGNIQVQFSCREDVSGATIARGMKRRRPGKICRAVVIGSGCLSRDDLSHDVILDLLSGDLQIVGLLKIEPKIW